MTRDNDFVPELAREDRIPRLLKAATTHDLYTGDFGRRARVLSPLTPRLIAMLRQEQVAEIEILSAILKGRVDLRPLLGWTGLRSVIIRLDKSTDWTVLESLSDLEAINLRYGGPAPQPVDFSLLRKLRYCSISWCAEWASVLSCTTLRHLGLEGLSKTYALDLTSMNELDELFLNQCSGLRTVRVSNGRMIESLAVAGCHVLEQIQPVEAFEGVRYLALSGRSRLDLARSRFSRLRKLWLRGMGEIESIQFLSKSRELEYLQLLFSTVIKDGDFSVIERLPRIKAVRFATKRHYSHTAEQLNALFRSRGQSKRTD